MRGGAYLIKRDKIILESIRNDVCLFLFIKYIFQHRLNDVGVTGQEIQDAIYQTDLLIRTAYDCLQLPIPRGIDREKISQLLKWKGDFVSEPMESDYDDGRTFNYNNISDDTKKELNDLSKFIDTDTELQPLIRHLTREITDFNEYIREKQHRINALKKKRLSYYCDDDDNYDMQLINAEIPIVEAAVLARGDFLLVIDEILIQPPSLISGNSDDEAMPGRAPESKKSSAPLRKSVTLENEGGPFMGRVNSAPQPKTEPMDVDKQKPPRRSNSGERKDSKKMLKIEQPFKLGEDGKLGASGGVKATRKNTKTKNKKTKTKSKNPKVKSKNKTKKRFRLKPMKISIGTPKASD
jgi:hypothetical protein